MKPVNGYPGNEYAMKIGRFAPVMPERAYPKGPFKGLEEHS